MAVLRRATAGIRLGVLAFLFIRPNRAERCEARAARIRKAYVRAAQDPDFLAEMAETDAAFDVAVADGLESASTN